MHDNAHGDIIPLVRSGELNDAFALAAKTYQFHPENEQFLELLEYTLSELGFDGASDELRRFKTVLLKHKALQAENVACLDARAGNRWAGEGSQEFLENPVWDLRAKFVAHIIGNDATVLDIGCGSMLIEKYLGNGCQYVPADVARRNERTILCDLEHGKLPEMTDVTHVVCLGVLNHLQAQRAALEQLCRYKATLLLTFKPFDLMKQKTEQGTILPPLRHKDVIEVLKTHYASTKFKKILGSGSEILYVAEYPRVR